MSELPNKPPNAPYARYIGPEQRGGKPGFWLICKRPFAEAADDMIRDAIQLTRPTTILSNRQRKGKAGK